jgi:choline dehydrogenase
LIFIRGQHEDFNDWAAQGASGWRYIDVLPHFKRIERYAGGAGAYHGASGELGVSNLRNDHPYCNAWVEAGVQFGLPRNPDFNGASTYGVGSYQLSIANGWRASSAVAFLRPVRARPNLTVLPHAFALRVLFEGTRASAVEFEHEDRVHRVRAEREIVLSAGAIQTPQLLQLSGVGRAALLRQLRIPVVADLPCVGENLQDHYQARTIVRLRRRVSLNDAVRNPFKVAGMGVEWLLRRSGPLTVGAGQVGGAACTEHAIGGRPDVQFNVMPLSVDKPGDPLHAYPGFTAAVWQCHPKSRGRVRIRSTDPSDAPTIEPRYLDDARDRKALVAGIRMLREIYAQPAFRDLFDLEVLPGSDASSDEALLDFARQAGGTVFHCVGTCRMGAADDADAVVDATLRVRGVERLRVVDASIMPSVTSANTNAAALMIGERGARMILGERVPADYLLSTST